MRIRKISTKHKRFFGTIAATIIIISFLPTLEREEQFFAEKSAELKL